MPGRARATFTGQSLVAEVRRIGERLGLTVHTEVRVGRRLWGAIRRIDVVLIDPQTRRTLGLECKAQGTKGTAEEKIPAIVEDIAAWPIRGLIVINGRGFSPNMRQFLISTGKAVELEDLENWLLLYFGLPLPQPAQKSFDSLPESEGWAQAAS
jgi:hypothetical protein